jgi:hypothetical protein
MGFNLCNSDNKINLSTHALDVILKFATFYGWETREDTRGIGSVLRHGIDDATTAKRLMNFLNPKEHGSRRSRDWNKIEYVISLGNAFIDFIQDGPYFIETFSIKLYEKDASEDCNLGWSLCKHGAEYRGVMRINDCGWTIIDRIARHYGWVPEGKWPKAWDSHLRVITDHIVRFNKWYKIDSESVLNLTNALRKAIESIMSGQRNEEDLMKARECDEDLFNLVWSEELRNQRRVPQQADFRRTTVTFLEKIVNFCEYEPVWIG